MTLEHWAQTILAALVALGGIAVWAFKVEGRLQVLETSFENHVCDKREALHELSAHVQRIEDKIDRLNTRCLSYAAQVHRFERDEQREGDPA